MRKQRYSFFLCKFRGIQKQNTSLYYIYIDLSFCCFKFRLGKEIIMYEQEVVDQSNKIEKMEADGKDEYDIKKQVICR